MKDQDGNTLNYAVLCNAFKGGCWNLSPFHDMHDSHRTNNQCKTHGQCLVYRSFRSRPQILNPFSLWIATTPQTPTRTEYPQFRTSIHWAGMGFFHAGRGIIPLSSALLRQVCNACWQELSRCHPPFMPKP